jgi:hypothetical protein
MNDTSQSPSFSETSSCNADDNGAPARALASDDIVFVALFLVLHLMNVNERARRRGRSLRFYTGVFRCIETIVDR